ncbi:hypothetical protein FANTH_12344 [Fusarium anthophilum]|uniref:C2H2-type domain-containing protein n=1 Tax=Fusarium anthophilum TaxID=48485 RepID=A0A8H4YU41_9HYPO|nr:hypothetical protein FANTH_12344 [Fusarium anthophilum]
MSSLCSQPMSYPSTNTGYSSTLSAHQPFTPTLDCGISDFGITYNSVSHQAETSAPLSVMGEPIFHHFKSEPEQISFPQPLPDDPMEQGQLGFQHEQMIASSMTHEGSMGFLTPSNSLDVDGYSPDPVSAASLKVTSSPDVSDSAETSHPCSCASVSPISRSSPRALWEGLDSLEQDWYFQPWLCAHHYNADNFQLMPAQSRSMEHDAQQTSTELQQAHTRSLKKGPSKSKPIRVDGDQKGKSKCDYPGCHKTFKRSGHLKRHKNSFHCEGPHRFICGDELGFFDA